MVLKRAGIVLAAVLLGGCGGDSGGGESDTPAPETKVNNEPRVEGRWRVQYVPITGADELRATWTTDPACDTGACSFDVRSTRGFNLTFRHDEALGDYRGRTIEPDTCSDETTGEVAVEHGYDVRVQVTVQPVKTVSTDQGTYVTEMFGNRRDRFAATDAGEQAGCSDTSVESTVRAVRIEPPAGKVKRIDGLGYGE